MCVLSGFDEKYCFLDDWWGIFHDAYENGGELVESSAQVMINYNLNVCLDFDMNRIDKRDEKNN